jgi:hypothetical protein
MKVSGIGGVEPWDTTDRDFIYYYSLGVKLSHDHRPFEFGMVSSRHKGGWKKQRKK